MIAISKNTLYNSVIMPYVSTGCNGVYEMFPNLSYLAYWYLQEPAKIYGRK